MISFWQKDFISQIFDYTIIGAGFTGLFSAYFLSKAHPNARIALCDVDFPPPAASTRNAGFACFGSPTEILEDLKKEDEQTVLNRIQMRFEGIRNLKSICGASDIDLTDFGGYEVFNQKDTGFFEETKDQLEYLNQLIKPISGINQTFEETSQWTRSSFKNVIKIKGEAQLNPFLAWKQLYSLVMQNPNVYGVTERITDIIPDGNHAIIQGKSITLQSHKTLVATNGFTHKLLTGTNLVPARAQVLITSPISNLNLRGSFHMDRGYVYFRNVGNRLLLGGYRNLDKKAEETDAMELNAHIQERLEELLRNEILPNSQFTIDHRWSGIMGFGKNQEKDYLLETPFPSVTLAVRLGGMGVAISSALAERAVKAMD